MEAETAGWEVGGGRRIGTHARAVHIIGLALILAHILAIACQREYWPVSHYDMYAKPHLPRKWVQSSVYGVTLDGRELRLSPRVHISPLDGSRWRFALRRMSPHERNRALEWTLKRYHILERRGAHGDPPLVGIRLYREFWRLDGSVQGDQPDRRALIMSFAPRDTL